MQDPSGIPHGSCIVQDPGLLPAQMRNASPLGPLTHSGSVQLDAGIGTPPDVSLSDDSLGLTPPKADNKRANSR